MILHKHHIIPRHIGGSNDSSNIKLVTIDEHAEEHRKLYEQYGRWQDHLAWKTLSGLINKEEALREISSNCGRKRKGSRMSAEAKQKISEASKRAWNNPERRKAASERLTIRNFSGEIYEKTRGRVSPHSEETKQKISKARTGKTYGKRVPLTPEKKLAVSVALKAKYARDKELGVGRYSKSLIQSNN